VAAKKHRPRLAVWKFASCDGCQLSLLDCEDELLAVADAVEIAYFPEATRGAMKGRYDVSLVEGSISTSHKTHFADIGECPEIGGTSRMTQRRFRSCGLRRIPL